MSLNEKQLTAEKRFKQAFERLKANQPDILPKNTPVSQNNIAKEAGCDPSALKKDRYPSLIREIQAWLEVRKDAGPTPRETARKARDNRRGEKETLDDAKNQRNIAQSRLLSAHQRILELTLDNEKLQRDLDRYEQPPTPLKRNQ